MSSNKQNPEEVISIFNDDLVLAKSIGDTKRVKILEKVLNCLRNKRHKETLTLKRVKG